MENSEMCDGAHKLALLISLPRLNRPLHESVAIASNAPPGFAARIPGSIEAASQSPVKTPWH